MSRQGPEDFVPRCRDLVKRVNTYTDQVDKLLTRNSIFVNRFKDVGTFSKVLFPALL